MAGHGAAALLFLVLCVGCALEPAPPAAPDDPLFEDGTPPTNLLAERVARFDPAVDYFPQKAVFKHATKLTVAYHRHFKVVDIVIEGMAGQRQQVLLVQRGTPRPSGYADATLVWVPVRRWSSGNYHYGGAADLLGVSDRLVSLGGSFVQATSPGIARLVREGRIRRHRSEDQAAALEPDVFLSWTPFLASLQDYEGFRSLGIASINTVERQEETPLGRSEWIKFLALLFNREAQAEAYFAGIEAEYERLATVVRGVAKRPRVLVDVPFSNRWPTVGGRNASARMIADAGGAFVFADRDSVSNQLNNPLELAYDRGLDADVWLLTDAVAHLPDLPGLIATNPYTRQLPMRRLGTIFIQHPGGPRDPNPYWDLGLLHPDRELADHIKMLHPELLPDHELMFYQSFESWAARSQETH